MKPHLITKEEGEKLEYAKKLWAQIIFGGISQNPAIRWSATISKLSLFILDRRYFKPLVNRLLRENYISGKYTPKFYYFEIFQSMAHPGPDFKMEDFFFEKA